MNNNEIVNKIVEHILAAPYGEDIITYDVASKVIHDLQTEYRGPNDGHVYTNGEVEIKGVDMFDIDYLVWNAIEKSSTHFFDDSETAAECLGFPYYIHKKIRTYSGLFNEFDSQNAVINNGNVFKGPILDEAHNKRYLVTIPVGGALHSDDFKSNHIIYWYVIAGSGTCNGEKISVGCNELFGNTPYTDDSVVTIENNSDSDLVIYIVDRRFEDDEFSVDEYMQEALEFHGLTTDDLTEEQLESWREEIESKRAGNLILDGVESELPHIALRRSLELECKIN